MPSASGIGAMSVDKDDSILKEGSGAGPSGEPTSMFNITDPGLQQVANTSIIENI